MELLHQKVIHTLFGEGEICAVRLPYFRVNFQGVKRQFVYPRSFQKFIRFCDPEVQQAVDIAVKKLFFQKRTVPIRNSYHVYGMSVQPEQIVILAIYR